MQDTPLPAGHTGSSHWIAHHAAELARRGDEAARLAAGAANEFSALAPIPHTPQPEEAAILRDFFGPLPFREPTIDPSCLTLRDRTPIRLAEAICAQRNPDGTLNNTRLAILADSLEEAGCANQELLIHLRQPARHWLGCFAVDLVLGKS